LSILPPEAKAMLGQFCI